MECWKNEILDGKSGSRGKRRVCMSIPVKEIVGGTSPARETSQIPGTNVQRSGIRFEGQSMYLPVPVPLSNTLSPC